MLHGMHMKHSGKWQSVLLIICQVLVSQILCADQPTISGVNAFWYLGGPLYDGAGCGSGGWCYYTQALWTANANGHAGTPTWSVTHVAGGGNVSLSCTTCNATTATSSQSSNGCVYDVTIVVTYPDGAQSPPFRVLINQPDTTSPQGGYPKHEAWYPVPGASGYLSSYSWYVKDLCGNGLQGFDVNETFGTWTNDYANQNWVLPTANGTYISGFLVGDTVGHAGDQTNVPVTQVPQTPLGTTKVRHDAPWNLWVGSQTFGWGVAVHTDTQQWWRDHGTHSVP